ncbi:MAG: efflux RND transporter permease subunit [Acidobacteriota bacterium]|nr:efflux RND transporter permease subunit [Acidobacteriota bacterium]
MTLPELAVRRPVTTLVLLVSIMVIGTLALFRLPLAAKPDAKERRIFVIAEYPNASPQAIERMIVRPLEEALAGIEGVRETWSRCDSRGGRVSLNFEWGVNLDLARAEIRDRLDRVRDELPDDLERLSISSNWRASETGDTILEGRISSPLDLSKNYELLERRIIRPLERVPGVAEVSMDGVNPREVKINLRMNALRRHNLDAGQALRAVRGNNADRSLGVIRNDKQRYTLRALGSFQEIDEIRRLPIPDTTLTLGDVAEITYEEPPLEYGRHLDGEFAVGVSVSKESSANTVEVCRLVRERVAAMADDPELEGINLLVWEDQGREITKTLGDLEQTGFFGAILACVILFLFLKRTSTTLIAVVCIPFSLIVACGLIWAQGKTLNTVSLLGLIVAIGMLVDNAVVIIENIDRYQQKGYRNKVSALLGAREVSVAVFAATLTSVIVFLPLVFSKPSRMNLTFKELAMTVCFTLLASLFVSQTLIPLCSAYLLKRKKTRKPGRLMSWMVQKYGRMLRWTLGHRWLPVAAGLLIIGSGWIPFKAVDMNFESDDNEMFVGMRYRFSEDLPLEKKREVVTIVENILKPHAERLQVKSIYSWYSDRGSQTRLYMKPGFVNEAHMNEVRKEMPKLFPKIAGVRMAVMDNGRFWDRNRGKRIGFQLQGPDTEVLAKLAEEAEERLKTVPDLFDHYNSGEGGSTELHTEVNRERVHAYGVDIARPSQIVELTFRGSRLPRFKGPDGEVEMRMLLEEQENQTVDQLRSLPVLGGGETPVVPLESLADFRVVKGPDGIRRSNRVTSLWVGARYESGKKAEHRERAAAALRTMDLPYGYKWNFNPGNREAEETKKEFVTGIYLALLLIFGVMAGLFESVRQAVALMISLPFAVSGAYWALHLTGTDMDQPAAVGVLLLLGIVVNNGIVMIEHINTYRRAGMSRTEAMVKGGRERLRPILITAITTLIGLMPMAIQQPALAGMYYYSMAFVIMGGLIVSTVLTLVLLPTTICLVEDFLAGAGRLLGLSVRKQPGA